jgi:hypothetical protein
MSDAEYVAGAGVSCPFCGSGDLEVIAGPQVDGRDCWQEVECRDCGKTWRDVYHLAGYEGTDEAGNYRDVDGKPQDPETGIYLVFVEGDIEPRIVGPFADGDERDKKARELRREHGQDHGIFMLDVEPGNGVPSIDAYCGGFFMEDEET